jgi:radical SAM protein (TIGR01212 family)
VKLYNDYSSYLEDKYGCTVYRIGLDAGFSCPSRCLYCNANGSRATYTDPAKSVAVQLAERIDYLKKSGKGSKFIAYFQAFTNTYAPARELKKAYDEVLDFKDIVGIAIGTRPDTVDRDKIMLIASYGQRYDMWIEYGLQSANDGTLKLINRGHSFNDFVEAVRLAKEFDISVSAHVILGLPGEARDDVINTAERLAALNTEGVKIHPLHILKGSPMENRYREGKIRLMEQDEYVDSVCDFLERLPPSTVIQRLTGQGVRAEHVAPGWACDKTGTIKKIDEEMKRRNTRQGRLYPGSVL